ncbi:MAG TPA: hypothetical protein VF629_04780 [Hymenobacter sp.]|jgi:hypothetical protein|uniref:hypothetical protein n=1 Tax=Hymenobacter sp. TaxID=1898978 RepID=UPI002EDAF3F3
MPPKPAAFATDQQRLARAGRPRPLPPPAMGDKTKLNRVASTKAVPKPVVMKQNTLLIRGGNGSQWKITFGDGNSLSVVDLTHYRFNHDIGHRHIDLTGVLPDSIGLDFNGGGAFGPISGVGGVNVLWHMRGETKWYVPEVHVYWGGALSTGWDVSKVTPVKSAVSAAVSVSIFLAWATEYDTRGVGRPAKSAWVANGFNWTGYFYSVGVSIPTPWGFNLVGSYFSSDIRSIRHLVNKNQQPTTTTVWWGVSLGVSWGLPKSAAMPTSLFEAAKFVFKKSSMSVSRTEYALVYGNGQDYNDKLPGRPDISGVQGFRKGEGLFDWRLGVNQNNY